MLSTNITSGSRILADLTDVLPQIPVGGNE